MVRPTGPGSARSVDAPFFPISAVDGFNSDSLFILTILLVDGLLSSRDALRSLLKKGEVTPCGGYFAEVTKLAEGPLLNLSALS